MPAETAAKDRTRAWIVLLMLLVTMRLPSVLQPAGGDQNLYTYVGQRVVAGDVPYRDAWDQKPPAIFFVYAFVWRLWPHESMVAAADLVAAAFVAWLLVILGRRLFSTGAGYGAAAVFLLFGNPGLQRLSGLTVRAQCETFIALAVTAALVLVTTPTRQKWHLPLAGVWLAIAFWLKYNALAFAVPVALAAGFSPLGLSRDARPRFADLGAIAFGFALVSLSVVAYFGSHGALRDLWRATIDYNLQYSSETYSGPGHLVWYVLSLPFRRARVDALWFLGGLGALLLFLEWLRPVASGIGATLRGRSLLTVYDLNTRLAAGVVIAWLVAAALSIAINGSRGLPQYFVQAGPALAVAAAGGFAMALRKNVTWRLAMVLLLVAAVWRVGDEPTSPFRPRLLGLPQLVENVRFDVDHWRGRIDRRAYLERFGGTGVDGKFSALAVDDVATLVRASTSPNESICVFGFASGGVYVKSLRRSASRFFWSRPVVLEFGAPAPAYGSAGLLTDLQRNRPAIVALQKRDWRIGEPEVPNSIEFFMSNEPLRKWLEAGYLPEQDGIVFAVWRRRS